MDARPRQGAGGILGRDFLTFLGQAAALGISPSLVLRADPMELELLVEATKRAHDYSEERDRALARLVISELADAMKRGRRGSK